MNQDAGASCANARAVARPIPRDAPVTRANLLVLSHYSYHPELASVTRLVPTVARGWGAVSDTSDRAALAQSTSFCTVGAPLTPIAPTTSPFTLMGNPPPHAAIRESVGMPAKSDGSPWMKLKNSCEETPTELYRPYSAPSQW